MRDIHLGEVEARFAEIIWKNAPVSSMRLVQLAAEELNWKKSTTYTVLKRLCEKGLFVNEGGTVQTLISKKEYGIMRGEALIDQEFSGSLPAFLAAFSKRRPLTEEEIKQLSALLVPPGKE